MFVDTWHVMRKGLTNEALDRMRANCSQDASASCINELGVAYLWLHDYQRAWEHFRAANQREPLHAADYYGMAGVAKWCINRPDEAVQQWFDGLACDYADAAGGAKLPLLLFFASAVEPLVLPRSEAERILKGRADDPRVEYWPGPLVEFVLQRIDEGRLRALCFDERYEDETMLHHWSADFYVGVTERTRGNLDKFCQRMQKTGTMSWDDFDACEPLFLSKLWSEEFFLARHEARKCADTLRSSGVERT